MERLTIAQALRKIRKLKGVLSEQQMRAAGAVTYKEESPPAFEFGPSLEAAESTLASLIAMETALSVTNAQTTLDFEGRRITLTEAVIRIQEIKGQIEWFRRLQVQNRTEMTVQEREWTADHERLVAIEKKVRCALPEPQRAARIEALQAQFDALNDAVETMNHRTVLVNV